MSDRSEADCVSNDLVERVARVICETENGPCKCMPDECGCTYWRAHARAAIAVVLEEAAKVCDPKKDCSEQDAYGAGFAAAIRAMIKEDKV